MDSAGTGAPDHIDDLDRGRAPDDRIIDEDDALAVEIGSARIVLQPNAKMANLITRLDKSSPDVMVADDSQLEGQPRFLGVADRCGNARIWNRHHDVRL